MCEMFTEKQVRINMELYHSSELIIHDQMHINSYYSFIVIGGIELDTSIDFQRSIDGHLIVLPINSMIVSFG